MTRTTARRPPPGAIEASGKKHALIDPSPNDSPGIAVVGMAGRFPGAADLAELWDNLRRGVESISRFSAEEMRAAGVDPARLADPRHVPAGGVLAGADLFDAPLFQATPREAELLDPQQRVFLECAWAALEDAAYDPARYGHGIGVFAGASLPGYLLYNLLPAGELAAAGPQAVLANDKDFLTTRVSYKLGLTGPSLDVQTACSTSLVAVILACQSLLNYQCDLALAGGVSVREPQRAGYLYQEGGILSPDGHCRPFDAAARGTVPGNGVGVVVLKRLEDALADGDAIRAVVRGAALNNDGSAKAGYTAPSVTGQAEVVAMALAIAGTPPEEVTFVETHGTATPLGDPIEVRALARAFRGTTAPPRSCALGSLKGNIGHLDAAAGIAGFLKAVLALENRAIPPTLHFERPNPEIDFDGSPFYVNAELVPWETADGLPRRAGVSSFGIGGTNAHVILEEAPPAPEPEGRGDEGPAELLVLSARTPEALDRLTARLVDHLAARPELPLADVAKSLRLGRRQLACRRAGVAGSTPAAAAALASPSAAAVEAAADPPQVAFLLPGQGVQPAGMARMAGEIYRAEEAFRDEVDACARALSPHLGFDLRQALVPAPGGEAAAGARLADTAVAQPALLALELALSRLWASWGVEPAALLGHSLGELAAAGLAGVLPRDEALALAAERGRLMAAMPEGAMLAVPLAEADLLPLLAEEGLSLAAVNAADRTVASGPPEAIARLSQRLAARGVRARPLDVRHAFHSPAIEPAAEAWTAALRQALLAPPAVPYLSNLTGGWATSEQATDPERWGEQMRRPVRFAAGVAELLAEPGRILLEVGPGAGLAALARRAAAAGGGAGRTVVASLPDPSRHEAGSAHAHLLAALGRLWQAGVAIDWEAVAPGRGRRVPLPTYPFERRRYWISAPGKASQAEDATGRGAGPGAWVPLWRQALAPAAPAVGEGTAWLVLTDGSALGGELLARLAAERRAASGPPAPIAAVAGPAFTRVSERAYLVDPESDAGYDALLAAAAGPEQPIHAVHLWSLGDTDLGIASVARLAGALGRRGGAGSLDVVTSGAVAPAGPAPEAQRAALAGLCRTIASERPCRLIDLPPASGPSGDRTSGEVHRLAERLAAELMARPRSGAIALRSQSEKRWVEIWEAVGPVPSTELVLRPGRSYLMAGDLGGPIAADLLAVLAGLPARVARVGGRAGAQASVPPAEDLGPEGLETAWLAGRAEELVAELDPAATAGPEALDALCGRYVLAAFARMGIDPAPGHEIAEDELRRRISLAPRRERLFGRLLTILEEDGAVVREDGNLRFLLAPEPGGPEALNRELESRSPELAGPCRLLARAARALPQVLSGELEGLAVLYPEGSTSLFSEVPADSGEVPGDFPDPPTRLLAEALVRAARAARRAGRPFRVLEVGGGQGLLTRHLLPALQTAAGAALEYLFTDIGRSFVLAAERAASAAGPAGGQGLRFGVLDVSRDPLAQGYSPGSFDAVVAANVVHATPRVVETLGHLRSLLAPGGVLGLLETVRQHRWGDLVWGLTDGWWSFADPELRSDSPLLAPPAWRAALAAAGFPGAAAFPEGGATGAGSALLLARQPFDPDDLSVPADLADPAQLAAALAEARRRLGGLDGVFFVAPAAGGLERFAATIPEGVAGARAFLAALALVAGHAPPRFVALCAEPAAGPALAAVAAEREGAPALAISWTGAAPGLPRLAAALSAALAGGASEVSLAPPSVTAAPGEVSRPVETIAGDDPDAGASGFHDRPRLLNPYVAPRDEVEQAVAALWRQALGIDRIGVDDNFLELGGDSLTGLQVAHAIQERWSLGGRTFSLYETPTVASIARFIAAGDDAATPDALEDQGTARGERRRARRTIVRRTES